MGVIRQGVFSLIESGGNNEIVYVDSAGERVAKGDYLQTSPTYRNVAKRQLLFVLIRT